MKKGKKNLLQLDAQKLIEQSEKAKEGLLASIQRIEEILKKLMQGLKTIDAAKDRKGRA